MMTAAAKLLVYQPSKMSTANVLARFIMELTEIFVYTFSIGEVPTRMPM